MLLKNRENNEFVITLRFICSLRCRKTPQSLALSEKQEDNVVNDAHDLTAVRTVPM